MVDEQKAPEQELPQQEMAAEALPPTDLIGGPIGDIGAYDVAFKDGKLVVEVSAKLKESSAGIVVKVDAAQVLDAIAAAIPGGIDDAIIGVIKAALLGK